jgi:hypothetical protein
MRLLSRSEDKVEDKWMNMSVPRDGIVGGPKDTNRASLPTCEF